MLELSTETETAWSYRSVKPSESSMEANLGTGLKMTQVVILDKTHEESSHDYVHIDISNGLPIFDGKRAHCVTDFEGIARFTSSVTASPPDLVH